jgi:hypothetical protein
VPPIQDYVRILRIDNNPSPLIFRITALLPKLECLLLEAGLSRYVERIALDYEANHRLTDGQVDSERPGRRFPVNYDTDQLLACSDRSGAALRASPRLNVQSLQHGFRQRLYLSTRAVLGLVLGGTNSTYR